VTCIGTTAPALGDCSALGGVERAFPQFTVPIPTQTRDRRLNRRPRPQHDSSTRLEWDSVIVRYRNSGSGAVPLYNMYMYPIRRGSAHGSAAIALKRHGSRLPCMVMLMVVCDLRPPRRAASRPAWYLESVAWTERAAHPLWTLERARPGSPKKTEKCRPSRYVENMFMGNAMRQCYGRVGGTRENGSDSMC
jgi:hypothetical protein